MVGRGAAGRGCALAGLVLIGQSGGASGQEDVLARGERLFHIGGCVTCHTAEDGEPLAGGDPLVTDFGTFHPPNITPDPETGIGGWSDEAFLKAMQEGITPDGSPYYPSFPYTSYTLMPDEDVLALKAYLDTLEPVRHETPDHDLDFPYNIRTGLWAWRAAHFDARRFEPDPAESDQWNRGAYLVEGPGHCGECHTPRTVTGALDRERAFAGNPEGPEGDTVPNITGDPEEGIGDWSVDEIVSVLKLGILPDGDFIANSMGPVVDNATSNLPEADLEAIATYLKSLPPR